MKSIEELKKSVKRAEEAYSKAKEDLTAALLKKSPVKVGDVVICTAGRWRGQEFLVCGINVETMRDFGDRNPWVSAHPKLKNGEFGNAVRHLYAEWKKK